jgi:hypothetical protein
MRSKSFEVRLADDVEKDLRVLPVVLLPVEEKGRPSLHLAGL